MVVFLQFRIRFLFICHLNVASAALGSQRERREEKTNRRLSRQTQEKNSFQRFVQFKMILGYFYLP